MEKYKKIKKGMENLVGKRFSVDSLNAHLSKLFKEEIKVEDVNVNDDDIGDYIAFKDDTPSFPKEEAIRLNTLLDDCFAICEEKGVDIYELADEIEREYKNSKNHGTEKTN